MRKKIRYLTELDVARLEKSAAEPGAPASRETLLDELLESAEIVESARIASNVVTMNSQITLVDERTGESLTWTLPAAYSRPGAALIVRAPVAAVAKPAKRRPAVTASPTIWSSDCAANPCILLRSSGPMSMPW